MTANNNIIYLGPIYFPGGEICPELMTEEEACRFLRLDQDPNRKNTLQYYRNKKLLLPIRIGKFHLYRKTELMAFLDRQAERSRKKTG